MSLFNFYHILPSTVFDFPVIDSGGPLLSKIYQVAEATQAPLPMVMQGGLATASFLLQNLVDVEKPNGQVVPPSQYFVTVAVSGERKTTVDNQFSQDLNELEADLDDNHEQEVLEYELEFEIWKAKKRGLLKAVVNDGDENAITKLYEHEQAHPKQPARAGIRTFSDVTPEAALDIFYRESINSAILRSSEGEEILAGPAARKLSLWNSLWGGDPVRVDRKTSSSFVVNPRTTLFIQAQPSIMQRFVAKGGENARGIGFFARTHITYPLTTQGYRRVKEIVKTPNLEYEKWVKELFELNVQASKATDFKRIKIDFSLQAKERWFIIANEIEREIRVGGRFEGDGDHASKLADNIARMAVLLHCAEHGLNEEVSLDTLNDAIRLSFWFSNEFIRLFQAPSEEQQDYFSLQGWFNQKRTEGYRYLRKNRVRKYGPNSLRDAGRLNITLDALHNNGEIRIGTMAKKTIVDLYPNYQDDQALLMSVINS